MSLSNKLELRRNIICRIAVTYSLTINDSIKNFKLQDSKGLEFNRVTLTGEQDKIFKALLIQHENKYIDEEEYFSEYFRKHLERGIKYLFEDYQKVNSPVGFLKMISGLNNNTII